VLPMDTTIELKANIRDITSESYVKMTLSELYRVKGTTAQAAGVIPDIELPLPPGVKFAHESDNPNVLKPITIPANKYFTPYPALPIAELNNAARASMQQSPYFSKVKQYYDNRKAPRESISLKLSDAVAQNELTESIEESDTTKSANTTFTVMNHAYQQQQLQMDGDLKEMMEEWTKFLSNDAYLKVAYDVTLKMIK
jgi:carboxyl-terminal processing protease